VVPVTKFFAVDPATFGDPAAVRAAASRYIGEIEASRKAPGASEIHIPDYRALIEREGREFAAT
jgi:LDH2 family malate/lactate/ureidoglycolate dehydrogenase